MASRVPVNPPANFSVSSGSADSADHFVRNAQLGQLVCVIPAVVVQGSAGCGEEGTRTPDLLLAKQALTS